MSIITNKEVMKLEVMGGLEGVRGRRGWEYTILYIFINLYYIKYMFILYITEYMLLLIYVSNT